MSDLLDIMMDPNGRALTEAERKQLKRQMQSRPRGHAWTPGTGPAGETCRSCKHYTRRLYAKAYLKCGLMRAQWTGGPKTDIRASDPACKKWERQE